METYKAKYFNDFILAELKNDFLKRVINNNLTESSWYFHRFIFLTINVIDVDYKLTIG